MSRKLAVVFLSMLVLTGAMGLKTLVAAQSDGTKLLAIGGAPRPKPSSQNTLAIGGAPRPQPNPSAGN